jgi:outer membrane protein assembly factor BamB
VGTDGTIYVGCQSGVHAVDSKGRLRWNCNCGDNDRPSYIESSPFAANDGTVYTTCRYGLVKLDINGNIEWKFPADEQTDQSWPDTEVYTDEVYIDQSQIAISEG